MPPEVQPVPASRSDEQVLPANHSPPNRRNPLSESPPFRFVFFGLEPPFPRVGLPVGPPALTVFASEQTEVSSALSGQFIRTNAIYYCKLRHFSSSASVFCFILFQYECYLGCRYWRIYPCIQVVASKRQYLYLVSAIQGY